MDEKTKVGNELRANLKKTFDEMPLLMVSDYAQLMKDVTNEVCDEYIKLGEAYLDDWATRRFKDLLRRAKDGSEEDN